MATLRPFRLAPNARAALRAEVGVGGAREGHRVRAPGWRIELQSRDVTREVSPMVLSVRYTDHAHGQSDDVEVVFADGDGRWRGPWRPEKGDSIRLWIGYVGGELMPCGEFEVDEIKGAGGPSGDTLTVRALAAGHTQALRERRDRAFEKQSLAQIVAAVARPHQLRVVTEGGSLDGIRLDRETQKGESDVEFLVRLADEYGFACSVRPDAVTFTEIAFMEAQPSQGTIRRAECAEWSLVTTTRDVYRACEASGHYVKGKRAFRVLVPDARVKVGSVHKLSGLRVTNQAQAEARARAALRRLNGRERPGSLSMAGAPRIMAGLNYDLVNFASFDGKYFLPSTTHEISRSGGYRTDLEVREVD